MLELMRDHLYATGIVSVARDMNEWLPGSAFDAVYFGNNSYMYGSEENVALFRKTRSALAPGGPLAVREFVSGMNEEVALCAMNMLVLAPRGNTSTASEYGSWLEDAGFAAVEVVLIPGLVAHFMLARNPG